MRKFYLQIFEADSVFFEGRAERLSIPSVDGRYGVEAKHENVVVPIVPGRIEFVPEDSEKEVGFVSSGMMRVEDNRVLILVESAERADEIDEQRALQEEADAKEMMLREQSLREYYLAEAMLHRAVERIKIKREWG